MLRAEKQTDPIDRRAEAPRQGPGVKLVRGPFISLSPHALHAATPDALPRVCDRLSGQDPKRLLAADLFSGAGGLSLGLKHAGIDVVLGVDHYKEAVQTHAHHFAGLSVDWDLSEAVAVEKVARLMVDSGIEVLCGGPPCQPFSKAGRSKIRHRVRAGERDPYDQRRDLWRSFIEVAQLAKPKIIIMENVPDMALDREMFIFRSIVQELESVGYSVYSRIMDSSQYGVPQFRQRLIVVALAGGLAFHWPEPIEHQVSLWNAIGDLPEVEGGWRPEGGASGFIDYERPTNSYQRNMRQGVRSQDAHKLFDHITRPVREDDAQAFALMDSETKYSDLPAELKRYRDDIFDDKYKRLDETGLSRTITAHIAKDGYWYIHPRQPRTLTVREAARIQTFPDWYRFAGGPTAAFKQIGNAVPPALGEHVAVAALAALRRSEPAGMSSTEVAQVLADWFDTAAVLAMPWLKATTRWQALVAVMLLGRSGVSQVRDAWPIIARWSEPAATLADAALLKSLGGVLGRVQRAARVLELAGELADDPSALDDDERIGAIKGVTRNDAELCVLAVPPADEADGEQPIIAGSGALRVAARFTGQPVDKQNRLTDGRLALARMVGSGDTARSAQLAIIEIGASLCRPTEPACDLCPLAPNCVAAGASSPAHPALDF